MFAHIDGGHGRVEEMLKEGAGCVGRCEYERASERKGYNLDVLLGYIIR